MKITYDKESDAMFITLKENGQYKVSKKVTDSFIVDTDEQGNVIGIEILHASNYVTHPDRVDFNDITKVATD